MMSSRVPARERIVLVRYKRTELEEGGMKDPDRASHNGQRGHSKRFWDEYEPEQDRDVTNPGFPHRRFKAG